MVHSKMDIRTEKESKPVRIVSNFFANEKCSLGTIEGTWVEGALNGQATSTYTNGICYTGEYFNNRKHGSGVLTVKDSYTYEGSFVDDKMDGKGRITWTNGTYYDGEWKAGKMNGKGNPFSNIINTRPTCEW